MKKPMVFEKKKKKPMPEPEGIGRREATRNPSKWNKDTWRGPFGGTGYQKWTTPETKGDEEVQKHLKKRGIN